MNLPNKPTDSQLYDACLSFSHDFGLMGRTEQSLAKVEALAWYYAWRKALETKEDYGTLS